MQIIQIVVGGEEWHENSISLAAGAFGNQGRQASSSLYKVIFSQSLETVSTKNMFLLAVLCTWMVVAPEILAKDLPVYPLRKYFHFLPFSMLQREKSSSFVVIGFKMMQNFIFFLPPKTLVFRIKFVSFSFRFTEISA